MKEHLSILIDDKNIDLWNELSKIYEVELISSPEQNYRSKVSGNIATISINENDLSSIFFTHELLQLYLKSKDVNITEDFDNALKNSERIDTLFSNGLKEHIINCLENELILPVFLKMGYKNQVFPGDFNTPKMNKKMLDMLLERYEHNGVYDREAVEFFIGTFLAMKSCNNRSFNYHKYFIAFQKLDKRLYVLLSEFWLDWKTFDFQDDDDQYDKILQYFINDIKNWISKKTIS
jgi:hypothetical protein